MAEITPDVAVDQADESFEESEREAGEAHGNDALERQNARTALTQEIGPLPPIKDPKRRQSCKYDLRKYALTYFEASCFMGLASYQDEMIQAFQDVILSGGKKCRAVRRGGLKSTLARIATSWAVVYGHRKFPVLVGATDDKSNEHRDNLFQMLATSRNLKEDFPELIPLMLKRKNPKKQLRLDGELLTVFAKDERGCIVFPTIAGVELSEARVAPYSILSTDVSGLSFVDDTGKTIRPDLLIFDDVQTPQSAKSFMQTESRENAVSTTFMGLAGLGETIAAIMVCTVREMNDLTNRFCDREKHPDWDGRKFPVLIAEPTDKQKWSEYGVKLRGGDTPEEGFANATAFYTEHRSVMDVGGEVAWEEDKQDGYLSALQWCMTIKSLQPDYFRCELQQEGTAPVAGPLQLSAEQLIKRVSGIKRGVVTDRASYLTGFVDSSDHVLWWMICAWQKDFTGWIVDYGTWPDQGRGEFYKSNLQSTIEEQLPGASWEEAFVHAHNKLEEFLLDDWENENGTVRAVDLLLKDWSDGGQKPRIEAQVSASLQKSRIRPSKGAAPKPGRKPVHLWGDPQKDRHTFSDWVERRTDNPVHVQFDANKHKNHGARRLQTVIGAPSCVLLPGSEPRENMLLAEHLTAEKATRIVWDGTPGTVWEALPGRDNDWWDCYIGNVVAASMLGCALPGESRPIKPTSIQVRFSELQKLARAKR